MKISIKKSTLERVQVWAEKHYTAIVVVFLSLISVAAFVVYLNNELGIAYNDARSHLDIGRRVVEGLKPGLAQLGSVWLPLNHLLMVPTIWIDWMWYSGAAGAIQSMVSFVLTGVLITKILEKLNVGLLGKTIAVLLFVLNINILYLQSTAMTELLLLFTMTAGCYYLILWSSDNKMLHLLSSAFFVMLSTLVRYDGWFLLAFAAGIVALITYMKSDYRKTEGTIVFYSTLGGIGIVLWFLWNQLIFSDPLYFAFGPFSAHAQQTQLSEAGELDSKYNLLLSLKIYIYAVLYNSYTVPALLALLGLFNLLSNKAISIYVKLASLSLVSPFIFNVLAMFLGFSVLFVQGISGDTWFNVRYGIMLAPAISVLVGYLINKVPYKVTIVGILMFVTLISFSVNDAVTIDDARVGSSQKNVSEVSGWLADNAKDEKGFILISAASHDAIIFSSGIPMKRYIHEGTGAYWQSATTSPDKWARWIVLRTHDNNDLTFRLIKDTVGFERYNLVDSYPFADIYELKDEYVGSLITEPVFGKNADLKKVK